MAMNMYMQGRMDMRMHMEMQAPSTGSMQQQQQQQQGTPRSISTMGRLLTYPWMWGV
jgi:hypothetical protein